ncbi:MAG: hypothetical protein R6V76_10540 [Desulfobacterales bacterium]
MKHLVLTWIMVLCLAGCGSIPFQSAPFMSMEKAEPGLVKEQFSLMLPDRFQIISTIAFEYKGQSISFIGYSDINTKEKTFTVAGINQVGIKLFEITGNSDRTELKFAIEDFTKKGNFTEVVAGDIRKIYFNRLPSDSSKVYKKKHEIVFVQNEPGEVIEFVFAGPGNLLVEKRCIVDNQAIWRVTYYEYLEKNGKLHPAGIILENIKYDYKLIMRLKEIRS